MTSVIIGLTIFIAFELLIKTQVTRAVNQNGVVELERTLLPAIEHYCRQYLMSPIDNDRFT